MRDARRRERCPHSGQRTARCAQQKKPLKKRCFVSAASAADVIVGIPAIAMHAPLRRSRHAVRRRATAFFFAKGVDSGKKRD
jgi:hypothetical protein